MNRNVEGTASAVASRERPRFRLHTFSSLRHRNFRLIWSTTFFSSAGMWVQQVTLGWLIYDLTESALRVGFLMAVRSVPALVAGPFAGVLIDRMDRRKLLISTHIVMAILALAFAALLASPYL